jgi:Toprim domain-containing protein/CHC2-type zinc finger protein
VRPVGRHRSPVPANVGAALRELGIDFETRTGEAWFPCPFHDGSKYTNFSVNLKTGLFACFSCNEKGNFPQLVEKVKGLPSADARQWARTRMGSARVLEREDDPQDTGPVDTEKQLNEASLALFTDPPAKELRQRNVRLETCRELGILWEPRYEFSKYGSPEPAWIIPVRDPHTGELWGWQAKGRERVKNYPKGVRKSDTLFGLQLAVHERVRKLILVESPLDVARLRAAGIRGGVSSFGVQISERQLALVTRYGSGLVLALDNDSKGLDATRSLVLGYRDSDKQWHPPFRRIPLSVWDYGIDPYQGVKDPGDQTDQELRWSLAHATSALVTRF